MRFTSSQSSSTSGNRRSLLPGRGNPRQLKPARNPSIPQIFSVSGVVDYYGYRYYHTNLGRWLSRDPIGETDGLNLFAFLSNRSSSNFDNMGLQSLGNPNQQVDSSFRNFLENVVIREKGIVRDPSGGNYDVAYFDSGVTVPKVCSGNAEVWATIESTKDGIGQNTGWFGSLEVIHTPDKGVPTTIFGTPVIGVPPGSVPKWSIQVPLSLKCNNSEEADNEIYSLWGTGQANQCCNNFYKGQIKIQLKRTSMAGDTEKNTYILIDYQINQTGYTCSAPTSNSYANASIHGPNQER